MKRLALAWAAFGAMALFGASAKADPWEHESFHDELEHRDFHRDLDHREAHRYPMNWRQHEQLHDDLDHEAFHDRLEHRAYHRNFDGGWGRGYGGWNNNGWNSGYGGWNSYYGGGYSNWGYTPRQSFGYSSPGFSIWFGR